MKISSANFKNSPIIKFLTLNTNVKLIEQMQKRFNSMEAENQFLKKEVKSVSSATATAANKWDFTYKSMVEDLKKRVRHLESKN